MKKITTYLPVLLLICCCCSRGTHTDSASDAAPEKDVDWIVTSKEKYTPQEPVSITIRNNTDQVLTLSDPLEKEVEVYLNEQWENVSILYCNCAPCPAPPQILPVAAGETHFFLWDKVIEKCNGIFVNKTDALPGRYRAIFAYSKGERMIEKLVVEFEL